MPSAKGKQLYSRAIWMLPTVPAVGTAGGGAAAAGGGRAGAAAAAAAGVDAAAGGRRGDRTSSGEAGAEASDMFADQKSQKSAGFLCYRCKQRNWIT